MEELSSIYYVATSLIKWVAFIPLMPTMISRQNSHAWSQEENSKHPSEELYAFAQCCFYIFKSIIKRRDENSNCANRMVRLFLCLLDVFPLKFSGREKEISCRLVNTFYKGFVFQTSRSEMSNFEHKTPVRKLRKLESIKM